METLAVVAQHRNQFYGKSNGHSPGKFGLPPSRGFRDINCRTYVTGAGLLPSPWKGYATPVLDRSTPSSKTQPRASCAAKSSSASEIEDGKPVMKNMRSSSPILINVNSCRKERQFCDISCFPELWAGPAYSNSPQPSSLPIPKFSTKPKRTVSLEFPVPERDVGFEPLAKSAPASSAEKMNGSSISFLKDGNSATKTLRRIFNLDIIEED